ncbi:MAG: pirin family protein [Pseudomonadales bacterium]|nr:pirin family protein [Pseudomonadales bacterium]MCP5330385.1 pirin family protein [Pseudomonadales bacterium]MCP5344002.1 pirin family protein [Pseudomonadales bacterium]
MNIRQVEEILVARAASDGDGVRLMRVFGGQDLARFDPFLMMDEFGSDEASDYIGGFPAHPHRGFETVTYMLEGHMQHRDHMGNVGELRNGDVQWMTAGSGVIHSEMPQQKDGRMRGFQLWLNLAARDKMQKASYRDVAAQEIPVFTVPGARIKAIAGQLEGLQGLLQREVTEPVLLDIEVTGEAYQGEFAIPDGNTVLVYVYEGEADIGGTRVSRSRMARMSRSGTLSVTAQGPTRLLLIAGKPLREPIVHYGPFVMNTREEIEQALTDYRDGLLTSR